MRFVWAVVAFVLAAVMIGAGIAQRTIFQGPKTETAAISVTQDAPYTLIDGAVLNALPGAQTLRAARSGAVFASYGRTADVKAWLADVPHNEVSLASDGTITTSPIEPDADSTAAPEPADGTEAGDTTTAEATAVPQSPIGSDLWLDEFQQEDELVAPLQLPDTMSVLIASDGTAPAPADISISWPVARSTPWAGPLIVGGAILMAIGVFLYVLGIRHARRSRGPRRKGLPVAVTEPIDLAVEGAQKGVISSGSTRRSLSRGRRAFAVVPAIGVSALLFAGCTADSWPSLAGSPTPSPSATVIVPEGQQAPAVTEAQAERILTRIADTVADADANRDPALAATRLDGAPLAERSTNYTLGAAVPDYAAMPAIQTSPLKIVLPQAFDSWPRTVMTVVDDQDDKVSSIMLMTQQDAWSPYKLSYLANLEAATEMPDLAASYVGATQVAPDSPFLVMTPDELATAYADILTNGDQSTYFAQFDTDGDQFRVSVAADRQRRLDEFNQTAASTGSLTFSTTPGAESPLALATLESGAIVAVNLNETDTVKPTNAEAVIKLTNNATVKALAGAEQSSTGFTTTYSDQLFFYVPSQGSTEKIRLLGYSSNILDAKVIP
ncbi:glycosyl transferase [Microbacterium sp. P01]|uniref:glycosyl transferase n=1 Tax=Microbacterium sp. P01 TaxID=3366261 RepID=UPI00366F29CC